MAEVFFCMYSEADMPSDPEHSSSSRRKWQVIIGRDSLPRVGKQRVCACVDTRHPESNKRATKGANPRAYAHK